MSLIEYPDIEQGSDAWLDQRRGIVTASVVGKLLTSTLKVASNDTARGLLATLVAERITGWTDPVFVSDDMLRGTDDEPRAVAAYAEWRGVEVTHTGFMVRDLGLAFDEAGEPVDMTFLGYSPDGLVGDDGLIECKSRRAKKQLQTILDDEVPAENYAQLQAGLLVSARAWCDYVSFSGGMPLWVKRVYPDPEWFDAIVAAVTSFELAASLMAEQYADAVKGLPMTERVIEMEMIP